MRILLVTILLSLSQWVVAQRDMKLLVVASQTEEAVLQKWITWREQTGVEVQTLWVEDVNAFPDAEEIQQAIRARYPDFPFTHILLIGDAWILPYHISTDGVLNDHGYGLLDDTDYAMDVAVGRLPFNDPTELEQYLDELIAYEKGELTQLTPKPNVLISASTLHHDDDHGKYLDQWSKQKGYATETLLQSNNTNLRDDFLYDLEHGSGWVTYFGHGSNVGWNSLAPGFSSADVANLDFTVPPVIFSAACASADPRLANNGSLAGQFMTRGALGFIGATEDCYYDYSDTLIKIAHKSALANLNESLGDILLAGEQGLLQYFPNNTLNLTHITMDHFLLLGDPTLIPFRQTPIEMELAVEQLQDGRWETVCSASGIPIQNSTVTITDESGDWLAIGETEDNGRFVFNLPEEAGSFTATSFKAGYAVRQKQVNVESNQALQLVRVSPGQWQLNGLQTGEGGNFSFYSTTGQLIDQGLVQSNAQLFSLPGKASGILLYHFQSNSGRQLTGKVTLP